MKRKITKALAVLLMLCMLLPQTALAATTYYIEVSISGPDAGGQQQTVNAISSRYGTRNDKLAATVVSLINSVKDEIEAKFSGTGLRSDFEEGLNAFDSDSAWEAYVNAHFSSVGGNSSFKSTLSDKSSTFADLTVDQANQLTYSGYTVMVTLREYTTGGSSSGGSSSSTTTTEKNPDGSTTTTTTNKNGQITETTKTPDGVTGTTVTNKDGQIVSANATISAAAAKNAAKSGKPVVLPLQTEADSDPDEAVPMKISAPKSAGPVKVEIPVENITPGIVAVKVNPDGTEEIIKTSVPTESGILLTVEGDATIKLVNNSKQFKDVQLVNHWAKDAIDFVTSRGLFNGKTEDTFEPNAPTTRAQLMTVLARLDGADTSGAALEKGMAWAVENGISDGSNPNATITRQQLAAMLYRYAGSPAVEGTLEHPDTDKVADYAKDAMLWAVQNGIINGKTNGTLDPTGLATRAQVATMMMRYCSLILAQ